MMRLFRIIILALLVSGCSKTPLDKSYHGLPSAQIVKVDGLSLNDSLQTVRKIHPNSFVRDSTGNLTWNDTFIVTFNQKGCVSAILGGKTLRAGAFVLVQGDSARKVLSTFPSFARYIDPDTETSDFNNIKLQDSAVLDIGFDEGKVLDFSLTQQR